MSSYLINLFISLKLEFISGLFAHSHITPSFLSLLTIIIGWFTCFNTFTTFLSIEIMIIINVIWRLENFTRLLSLIIRFVFSRIVAWWLFYTLYSQFQHVTLLEDSYAESTIVTALSFLTLPLLLSWYIFYPFLLPYRRYSLGDRFDYFLSRFSFFTGYGLLPLLLLLILIYTHNYYFVYIFMCIICSHQTRSLSPNYAKFIPYTKNQFIIDPLDWIESTIDRYI